MRGHSLRRVRHAPGRRHPGAPRCLRELSQCPFWLVWGSPSRRVDAEQQHCACGQGKRGALPSSTIMLRQPMQRFTQMQASDIDIYRNELRKTKNEIVRAPLRCPA